MKVGDVRTEKQQIIINLPKELLDKLKREASEKGIPLNTYITILLQEK